MNSANQARLPITEDGEALRDILYGISPLLLALSSIHMSGRLDIIRSGIKPRPPAFNGDTSGSLSPGDAAWIRDQAHAVILAYRDAGYPEPYRPSDAELHEMMCFLMGLDLPAAYVPMVREDMAYDAVDSRAFEWTRPVAEADKARATTVIVGGGMSGMLMGLRLKQAGVPFVILEKNDGVGGTWFENRYPGLRVDVPSHAYSFSFIQDHRWENLYSWQPDLLAYFAKCAERFGIPEHIRFGAEVVGADWDERAGEWAVTVRHADGSSERMQAAMLVSACGFFNKPFMPDIEGRNRFKGVQFHSAGWPSDLDLAGKRVAIIGNAATALQLVPPVAEKAAQLTIFQRSPSWTFVNPEYDRKIRDEEHWAFERLPYYAGWMRAIAFNWTLDLFPDLMMVDPEWPQDGNSVSALNEMSRKAAMASYNEHLGERPDLLEKLVPDYPPYVKRPTIGSGNFFDAIKRDTVALVNIPIERFDETGIIDRSGTAHPFDVIIFTTGFRVQEYLAPMVIRGRGGVELNQYWDGRPGGYLGMMVPTFPNFFMMYGPGTNLGYNGNLIYNSELQAGFIAACVRNYVEAGRNRIEVSAEAYDDYMQRTEALLAKFVWSTSYGTSYFRDASGRVTTNSPWSLLEVWEATRELDSDHFV